MVGVSAWSCSSDDEALVGSLVVELKSNFRESMVELNESESKTILIDLDQSADRNGYIDLSISGETEGKVYFDREIEDGKIRIPINKGESEVGLVIFSVDNKENDGDISYLLTIVGGSTGVLAGTKNLSILSIKDNEIENPGQEPENPEEPQEPENPGEPQERLGIPKSFETFSGSWRYKKTYEYDEFGRLSKVYWETETPMLRTGTTSYYYNDEGFIELINYYPNVYETFNWVNGQLVRSEKVENGKIVSYSQYDRDPAGNLGGMITYNLQSDGSFKEGLTHIYLYFDSHNIYKHLVYTPDANGSGDILLSTKTYDGYSEVENHFPMVEILPTIKMQPNLPGSHSVEENGYTFNYTLSYYYDEEGLLLTRTVSSVYGGEITRYEWY